MEGLGLVGPSDGEDFVSGGAGADFLDLIDNEVDYYWDDADDTVQKDNFDVDLTR